MLEVILLQSNKIRNPSIYASDLWIINGVRFSPREMDVLSAFTTGRSSKKISLLLSISPRTVESHIYNIMHKLNCNSRQGLIELIDENGYYDILRDHYLALSNKKTTEFQLLGEQKKIKNLIKNSRVADNSINSNVKLSFYLLVFIGGIASGILAIALVITLL